MRLKSLFRIPALFARKCRLQNHDFSIISNTCIGGVMSHCLGEQFRSPTVNLIIYENDFLIFCRNLRKYAECPLELPAEDEKDRFQNIPYPVGILRGQAMALPDIAVYFVHYNTFEDAKKKWVERFKRVNYDNLFILMDRGMDATEEILDGFHALPYARKVFFTNKENPMRWPCTFRLSYYTPDQYVTAFMYTPRRKGLVEYLVLDEFDYVQWLNDGSIRRSAIFD